MEKISAGILLYRRKEKGIECFLVHLGGPFWAKKDEGAWSIPKGELEEDERPIDGAKREFSEETGFPAPEGAMIELAHLKQKSGKLVAAFAAEGDCDPDELKSNTFTMEWPPRSGKQAHFPECDRGAWFAPEKARQKISPGQRALIDELEHALGLQS